MGGLKSFGLRPKTVSQHRVQDVVVLVKKFSRPASGTGESQVIGTNAREESVMLHSYPDVEEENDDDE